MRESGVEDMVDQRGPLHRHSQEQPTGVGRITQPAAQVDFVNGQRRFESIPFASRLHPIAVAPPMSRDPRQPNRSAVRLPYTRANGSVFSR